VDEARALIEGARLLGLKLSAERARTLVRLLDELERWNAAYNLTAIRGRPAWLTHHLLDSLAIHADLAGTTVADVGTGAGFPGLPLAIVSPERQFTLIDSGGKKIRFVTHAVRALELANVTALKARVEALKPERPFDTVVARAFAPLPELAAKVAGLAGAATRVLALKGKYPQEELAGLAPEWSVDEVRPLRIPGLEAERHLVVLTRRGL